MKKNLIKGILSVCLFASIGANIVQARTIEFKQSVIMSFARDSIQQKETIKNLEEDVFSLENLKNNPSDANCELLETMWVNPNIGTAYSAAIDTPYSAAISTAYSVENGGSN